MSRHLFSALIFGLIFILSLPVFALVEYDDAYSDHISTRSSGMSRSRVKMRSVQKIRKGKSASNSGFSYSTHHSYQHQKIDQLSASGADVEIISNEIMIKTPYDFYLKTNFKYGKNLELGKNEYAAGNLGVDVNFDWFQSGERSNLMRMGIEAGITFAKSHSYWAHSYNQKFIGINTSKKFNNVILYLNNNYYLNNNPENPAEMALGNYSRWLVGLGWIVSNDIRFALEYYQYALTSSENKEQIFTIDNDITLSSLKLSLILRLFPKIDLELGSVFRTSRWESQTSSDLLTARLFDINGAYGNTLFTGVNISI